MAIDINKIKNRLSSLSNTNNKSNLIWKPNPGKQTVRIVSYKYVPENPFIELKFHYNVNGKTYLSPDTFGRPDPIVEFSNKLKTTGDKEDWKMGRSIEPKLRTFVPVIVRGEEGQGVRFWGFGKQVYQELLSIIADPDYGDITDLASGRDVTVEFKTAEEAGKNYPETSIRVKPNTTPAVDPGDKNMMEMLKSQTNIMDLFPEPSYDDLKDVMDSWLNPDGESDTVSYNSDSDDSEDEVVEETDVEVEETPVAKKTVKSSKKPKSDDVAAAFDELFNS